jgi:hypothetical protein
MRALVILATAGTLIFSGTAFAQAVPDTPTPHTGDGQPGDPNMLGVNRGHLSVS